MSKYLVAKKFFENSNNGNLPYDAEIEYLEGNGGIINTGHIPTLNTSMEFEMMPLEYTGNNYIGFTPTASEDDSADFRFFATGQNHIYFDFSYGRIDKSNVDFSLNNWYTVRCYNYGVTINGTTYSNSYVDGYIDSIPIYIFGTNDAVVNFKLKYLKIYENNELVQDLIPVRKGTIGYMYDKVSGQLFENQGSGNFILGQDTKVIEPEIPEENQPSTKFIIGKRFIDITDFVNPNFSSIKKHFETKFQLSFDTDGGNLLDSKEVVLGKSYGELPIPTKAQNIFIGWFTSSSGGTQITSESIASLDINTLYAHWEYVEILDSESHTEYEVVTTSSYRNTGIYTASIADSSQPIYIDWGDGTVEKTTSSISQKSHTYKTNGNFTVKISDNITSFAPSYSNSTWYGTTSQNRYTFKGMISTGSKVTSLPTYAFYYCQAMTNIDFMETCYPTVTSLPNYCFYYCTSLTSIQGAKRFTSLGSYCFQYCSGLTGIQDLSEFKFTSLPNSYTFANCTNVTQWILPDGFNGTSFGSYMFSNNSKLTNVGNIEKTINQIKAVQIEYLETIGSQCIDTKLNIQSTDNFRIVFDFQFLTRKTTNNQYIFSTANNWLSFEISINSPYDAYSNVGSTIGISWTNTTIPYNQWIHCDYNINAQNKTIDITGWQNINSSYSGSHGTGTFYICSRNNSNYVDNGIIAKFKPMQIYMNDILVRDLIPVRVGNVGYMYDKVSGQLFGNSGTGNFILGPDKTDAEEIIIEQETITSKLPESLTSTGTYTFQNCSNLNNIIIPSNVQSIGNYAFYGCTSLNNVNIESTNLTAINQYAFYNCNKLVDLDLPDTVKTIGNYAFYGCTNLDYVGRMANDLPYDAEIEYLESDGNQWIDTDIIGKSDIFAKIDFMWLDGNIGNDKYIIGSSSGSTRIYFGTYQSKWMFGYGGYFQTDGIEANIRYKANISWMLNDQYVEINNIRIIENNSNIERDTELPLYLFSRNHGTNANTFASKSKLYSCIIYENNILVRDFIPVRVGNVGYMYDKISGQLFGNSGTGNFILGPDVKTKELPSQLTSIGTNAYQGCSNLKSLNIPENLQTIGDYAFAGCYQISSIVDKRLTAQTVSTNTFGSATGTSNTAFTGYQTKGNNILSTYFAATGYDENAWDDPLQNPDKCGFIQQYIDPENIVYHTVTFDAGVGNISETSRSIIKGKKIGELPTPRCPVDTPYFGGWFTNINGTGTKVSKDYRITNEITFYALYSIVPFTVCNIDLNNQWRVSSKTNPDSSLYDGPYESNSNYNIGNAYSKMYIRISGYSTLNVYIRSYAESSYDYVVAMNLDVDVTSNPSSGTSNVKAHTSGKQNSGTSIGSYTKVEYTDIPDGEHFICIVYRKDGSVNDGDDRGYVLIDKQDVASTDSRSIFLVDDVGILYDEDKQLMIASERI